MCACMSINIVFYFSCLFPFGIHTPIPVPLWYLICLILFTLLYITVYDIYMHILYPYVYIHKTYTYIHKIYTCKCRKQLTKRSKRSSSVGTVGDSYYYDNNKTKYVSYFALASTICIVSVLFNACALLRGICVRLSQLDLLFFQMLSFCFCFSF